MVVLSEFPHFQAQFSSGKKIYVPLIAEGQFIFLHDLHALTTPGPAAIFLALWSARMRRIGTITIEVLKTYFSLVLLC